MEIKYFWKLLLLQKVVSLNYKWTVVKKNLQTELIALQIKIKISHSYSAEKLTLCTSTTSELLSFDVFSKSDPYRIWAFFRLSGMSPASGQLLRCGPSLWLSPAEMQLQLQTQAHNDESAAALCPRCSSTGKGSPGWMCSLPSREIQHVQPQRSAVSVVSVVLQLCNAEHPQNTEIPVLPVACFVLS